MPMPELTKQLFAQTLKNLMKTRPLEKQHLVYRGARRRKARP